MSVLSKKAALSMTAMLFLGLQNCYAQSEEKDLCAPFEEIYFSCPVGHKVISVCASGNISPENGYVQYRIGRPGRVEFQYPKMPDPPRRNFAISDISGGNLNIVHLKFKSGSYNYVLYQGNVSGVYVKENGKIVANLMCGSGGYKTISPRAMRGIDTVPPVDGVD